jgi:Protein of unknown function (DUF2914)
MLLPNIAIAGIKLFPDFTESLIRDRLPYHREEVHMKFGAPVVCFILLSALVFSGQPAWSQEATQDAVRSEAQPAAADLFPPTASDETQAVVPDESQPSSPSESRQAAPGESRQAAPGASQTAIRIPEAVVCQDVVNRAPVGAGDIFPREVPRVYCFTHVVGAAPGTQLIHNWYYQGNLKASVKLSVGSSDYRTWSYKTMIPQWSGEWMVEILSADGTPLDNITFSLK